MSLSRAHAADTAETMIDVVPAHEVACPSSCRIEIDEAVDRELGAVLGSTENRGKISLPEESPLTFPVRTVPVQESSSIPRQDYSVAIS